MKKTRKKHSRDPYIRKLYAGYDQYLKNMENSKTLNKQELREEKRRRNSDPEHQHENMVRELFQNLNKYVFDDKMLILFQPRGDVANLIVVGEKYETYFGKLFTHKITDDESVFRLMAKAISDGDRYFQQVALKPLQHFDNEMLPKFVHNPNYYTPQLDLRAGGYVDIGSYRHFDHINCLLTRDEFVVTAQAVRGLGKGSYRRGGEILYNLQEQWRREAKNYSHVR